MACNIYLYIEYLDGTSWVSFGKYNCPRDYEVFGALAPGVMGERIGTIPAKGLPKDVSWLVSTDNVILVQDKLDIMDDTTCTKEQANLWLHSGLSKPVGYHGDSAGVSAVTNPTYSYHSWLTLKELKSVLADLLADNYVDLPYVFVMDVLQSIENRGYKARVVFWFGKGE